MSRDYDIVCCTCRVVIGLGKIHNPTPDSPQPEKWAFGGVFLDADWREVGRHGGDDVFCQVLQKFLILHRNHEIRVVPEGVSDYWEGTLGPFTPVEPEAILAAPLNPPLDWAAEREHWRQVILRDQK